MLRQTLKDMSDVAAYQTGQHIVELFLEGARLFKECKFDKIVDKAGTFELRGPHHFEHCAFVHGAMHELGKQLDEFNRKKEQEPDL